MNARSARRSAAALAALVALASPLAACREGRPRPDAIANRLLEAAQNPEPSHLVSSGQYTVTMPFGGDPAMRMRMTMAAEQWTRDAEHLRSETTLGMAFDMPDGAAADAAAQMAAAMGMDEWRLTTVRNGPIVSSHESLMNSYTTIDIADLPAEQDQPSQAEMADLLRTAVKDLVAGYLLNPLDDREIAGRSAFRLAVVPRNASTPALVFHFFRIQRAVLAVDKDTYEVLALEGEGVWDISAGAARIRAEGSSGPFGAMMDQLGDVPRRAAIPVAFRHEVTQYEINPTLSDELFTFVPPAGATEIDPFAMATMAAAMAEDGAGDGVVDQRMATAMAQSMANTLATLAPPAATPTDRPGSDSAEAVLAAEALRALAVDAAFTVVAPDFVPSGCAVTESGRIPDEASTASPPRLVWVMLTCPDGAIRVEEKAASDTALSFDEADSEQLTAMVAGERVPYFRRADGTSAVLVANVGGTSLKVSGAQDVTVLVRIAESMR